MAVNRNHNATFRRAQRRTAGIVRTPSGTFTFTSRSARGFVRIARFTRSCADRSQTQRFCEALLREMELHARERSPYDDRPQTIFFGGGTPTALTTAQLEYLLGGFRDALDLSRVDRMDDRSKSGKRFATQRRRCFANSASLASVSASNRGTTIC